MSFIEKVNTAINNTLQSQWKDIITVNPFNEFTTVQPGIKKSKETTYTISNLTSGSRILVPENTCAIILINSRIEEVITEPGLYIFNNGEKTIFNGSSIVESIFTPVKEKIGFGGLQTNTSRSNYRLVYL